MGESKPLAFSKSRLSAKFRFKLRMPTNYLFVVLVFLPVAFVAALSSSRLAAWVSDAVAIAVLFYLYRAFLEKRAIKICCPHCLKYIRTNTPWMCGSCEKKNEHVDDFPFVNRCEHCGVEPKAYQCHHCEELIFFTKDKLRINYAICANFPVKIKSEPARKDPVAGKIAEQNEAIRETEYKLRKAKLDLELKGVNEYLEPKKEMTQAEILSKSAQEFTDRHMSGPKIAERLKGENAEKFKNNPVELEKANLLVDQWVRNNLDRM